MFKISDDNLIQRCVVGKKARDIMWHCHNAVYGGHHSVEQTIEKVFKVAYGCQLVQRL